MADPLLEYADLLREYQNPDAREVRKFVARHGEDKVFAGRVQKLNALFLLQAAFIEPDEAAALRIVKEAGDAHSLANEGIEIGSDVAPKVAAG